MRITSLVVVSLAPIFDFARLNLHVPPNGLLLAAIATMERTGSAANNTIFGIRILFSFWWDLRFSALRIIAVGIPESF
jgi:hypothetical protein